MGLHMMLNYCHLLLASLVYFNLKSFSRDCLDEVSVLKV